MFGVFETDITGRLQNSWGPGNGFQRFNSWGPGNGFQRFNSWGSGNGFQRSNS